MRARFAIAVLATLSCCGGAGRAVDAADSAGSSSSTTNALARSVSATQQFIAYAAHPQFAAQLCAVAEKAKREWLRTFAFTDKWRDPVVLVVRERSGVWTNAPSARAQTFRSDLHLKYQIDFVVPPPVEDTALLAALLETLCAEYANRNQPTVSGSPYVAAPVPLWLAHGVAQLLIGRPDLLLDALHRSVEGGQPTTATSLLMADKLPVDPAEREIFFANAWALTQGLFALPNGTQKMQQFLAELGTRKSVNLAFNAVFQRDFPTPVALEKWWSLYLVNRSVSTVAQALTTAETAQRLDAIRLIRIPSASGGESALTLDQIWQQADQPWLQGILQSKLNELQVLRSTAHPLYVATIDLESQSLAELLNQKFSRYRRTSVAGRQARAAADKQAQAMTQYLNEVEARTLPAGATNEFHNYFRILEQSQALGRVRVDPIRDYLDQFDKSAPLQGPQ